MIDLITGHQGMPHISAKQISDLNNAMMEGYGADKIMRMKDGTITLTNNDVFTVNPGYWRVNGYDMEIQQTETIQIERPTGNLKRYDDIYIEILRDIPSGAERAEIVKVEGSPASSNPSHPPVPTEPELTTDVLLLCIQVGYVYATSTYTTKHDDTIPYHYVSETEYTELLTHLLQEQYARARMSSGNFAPIRVDDIIKLNTKGTWTHTDPAHPGAYSYDTYTLYSGNIVFQISSNELGLKSILVTTSSTSGYSEKLILFKGEVGIGTDNLWLPRNGSQVPSGLSAAAIVNGEEYSVGTGGYYVELPSGVLTELYIQATSGISGNTSFYPTIRYEDDPTYTRSYPPAPTNIMLWNEINDVKKDLLSEMSDKAPYLFRKSKGDMVDLELVGYSLAVNQLVQNGDFSNGSTGWSLYNSNKASLSVANNIATVTCLESASSGMYEFGLKANTFERIKGRVYKIAFDYKTTCNQISVDFDGTGNDHQKTTTPNKWERYEIVIKTINDTANATILIEPWGGVTVGDTIQVTNVTVYELTLEFGTDIADHIYSKEQATAGSGIAWIKSFGFFSKLYEPFNLGSIQSVKTSGRKVVGKNLIDVADTSYSSSNYIFEKTINLAPAGTYTFSMDLKIASGKACAIELINDSSIVASTSKTTYSNVSGGLYYIKITSSSLFNKVRVYANAAYEAKQIQFELGSTATDFEPYTSTTVALPNEDLRGVLLRDGDNLYAYGDTDIGIGNTSRKYVLLNLGLLTWTYDSTFNRFTSNTVTDMMVATARAIKAVCARYVCLYNNETIDANWDNVLYLNNRTVTIHDHSYTDAATFKAAMNGVYLVYPLATPTIESSNPWQNPQRVFSDGTEEFIDDRDVPIPVGNVSKYTSSEILLSSVQDYVDGAVNIHEHATVLWELPEDFDYENLPYVIHLSGDLSQYDYIQAVICHSLYNNEIEGGMEIITFKDTGADTGNINETAIENSFNNSISDVTKITRYREFSYSYNSKTFGISDNCYKIKHKYTKTNPVETLEDFIIYNGSSYYYMLYPIKIIGYKY